MAKDPQASIMKLIDDGRKLSDDGSITVRELADLMGCGPEKARKTMTGLVEAGKMKACRSPRVQKLTGVVSLTWAYKMV